VRKRGLPGKTHSAVGYGRKEKEPEEANATLACLVCPKNLSVGCKSFGHRRETHSLLFSTGVQDGRVFVVRDSTDCANLAGRPPNLIGGRDGICAAIKKHTHVPCSPADKRARTTVLFNNIKSVDFSRPHPPPQVKSTTYDAVCF